MVMRLLQLVRRCHVRLGLTACGFAFSMYCVALAAAATTSMLASSSSRIVGQLWRQYTQAHFMSVLACVCVCDIKIVA
jgi:hypothetical protein